MHTPYCAKGGDGETGRVRFVVVREKGDVHDVHAFVAPVREKVDAGGGGDASAELIWIN